MPDSNRPTDVDGEDVTLPAVQALPPASPGERYQIGNRIGQGGMGEVVAALDVQIGREVAIKRMHGTPSDSARARFLREARIQGRLEHPAIVPVHELSHDDAGNPFFVMKRLSGITLGQIIADRDPRFGRERLLRAFSDVCLAVEFAHQRGIVHRDLKPANIMLGDFGEVYVLDWGIARVVQAPDDVAPIGTLRDSAQTVAGAVFGTPGFMPPEQMRGEADVDARADVFALGAILYEILAGVPMLEPELGAVLRTFDARPSRHAGVPPELDALCVEATAPARAQRLASARALSERVQRFLDGDRDLALRRKLASDHIDEAFVAFARKDDHTARRIAMQAAGKALALDPTASEAAALVSRLMLEPPAAIPREVIDEVEAFDAVATRKLFRLSVAASACYVFFLPFMYWTGVRDPVYLAVIGAAVLVNTGIPALGLWRDELRLTLAISLVANACMIAMMSRLFSPFTVAPGIAIVTAMAFAYHPRLARRPVWLLLALGALGPWVLELAGIVSRTIAVSDGNIIITQPALAVRLPQIEIGFAFYTALLILLGALIARSLARTQYDLRCKLQLQAWQLRQIVPT